MSMSFAIQTRIIPNYYFLFSHVLVFFFLQATENLIHAKNNPYKTPSSLFQNLSRLLPLQGAQNLNLLILHPSGLPQAEEEILKGPLNVVYNCRCFVG